MIRGIISFISSYVVFRFEFGGFAKDLPAVLRDGWENVHWSPPGNGGGGSSGGFFPMTFLFGNWLVRLLVVVWWRNAEERLRCADRRC